LRIAVWVIVGSSLGIVAASADLVYGSESVAALALDKKLALLNPLNGHRRAKALLEILL
jgi:hypothetical protein